MNKIIFYVVFAFVYLIAVPFCAYAGPLVSVGSQDHFDQTKEAFVNENSISQNDLFGSGQTGSLSELPKVFVKRFRFEGNTAISDKELSIITLSYENREVTFEELQTLRQALTLYYINKGYVTSGVIIPDQAVTEGVVTFRVIEGSIKEINIEGNRYFHSSYISKRILREAGPPVNVYSLQKALLLLQQDPRIRKINSELGPGILQGENIIKVHIEENQPFKVILRLGNNQSPSIGEYRGEVLMSHQNLTGYGDTLDGNYGLTEGVQDYGISYSMPVNKYDTIVNLHYRKSGSIVIEDPFEGLDIESRSDTFGITVSHPVYRTSGTALTLSLTAELRQNRTSLLGSDFSFSEGPVNGKSNVTVLRFSQEWVDRSRVQVIAARSIFSLGIDAFGATTHADAADGRFLTWLGQFQWIRQLGEKGLQIRFRTDIQLSNDDLLPLEKFSVGGMNSVRGFRENELVRDNGLASSTEIRIPVFYNRSGESIVHIVPFVDFGWSWNTGKSTPSPRTISSAGLGVIWAPSEKINLQVYGGIPFRKIESSGKDLQSKGIHALFTVQII